MFAFCLVTTTAYGICPFLAQYLAEAASLTPDQDLIKRLIGDHAALSLQYADIPPLYRPNSSLGNARPKTTGN